MRYPDWFYKLALIATIIIFGTACIVYLAVVMQLPESTDHVTTVEEYLEEVQEPVSLGEHRISFYCSCPKCCGEWSDGLTYTETVATEGRTIAVDPQKIPLGSTVYIDGLGEFVAEDIGGAIKENRIDIYLASHDECISRGIEYREVWRIEE